MTKICSECRIEKPISEFYKAGRGHQAYCIACAPMVKARYKQPSLPPKPKEFTDRMRRLFPGG